MSATLCSIDGCESAARARGWCPKHWQRWRRNGHPTIIPERKPRSDSAGHATRRMYDDHGCRCLRCAVANSEYYQQLKDGPTRIPVGDVIEHIERLVADGWTYAAIAREAGIGPSTPWYIRSGRQQQVNRRTAEKIMGLAVSTDTRRLSAGPLLDALRHTTIPPRSADAKALDRAAEAGTVTQRLAERLVWTYLSVQLEAIYGDLEFAAQEIDA